jgi:ElaA protein
MVIEIKSFDTLSNDELYAILKLRQEIFVVEQNCAYLDCDDKDQKSHHLMLKNNNQLVAYTRLMPIGLSYKDHASIGRVVTQASHRGKNLGYKIMKASVEAIKKLFPNQNIKISAQVYTLEFYKKIGFEKIGAEYLEDGIPHQAMIYTYGD